MSHINQCLLGSCFGCQVLKGHDDHVITCLQFCGNRIVSGSDDNTLKVWSAVTGKVRGLLCSTPGEMSQKCSCAFTPCLQGGLRCPWGRNGKRCWINTWVAFSRAETPLVQRSHLDMQLQCCSCYHWYIPLFSWQFCCSCGVVCDTDFKEFGQKHYFIFLKA